ncbi:MAG: hypothetical protein VW268_00030 [Rhodospirillaceae bacterium]
MRNKIAHKASSPELMDKGFTVHWLDENRLLALDAEVEEFPLITTVRELASKLRFFVLKGMQILLSTEPEGTPLREYANNANMEVQDFAPTWANPCVP